jgi:glycosidase
MGRRILPALLLALAAGASSPGQPVASRNARTAPAFLNRSVIYQVWMRSFTPEGTLKAVTARLPHIVDLGADIVYLSPLNVHGYPSVFGPTTPYEIKDYDRIDPEYGTEEDLKALAAEAHKLGLKVIMDVVYSHSANDCVLLLRPGFFRRTPEGSLVISRWKTLVPDFSNPQVHDYFRENMLHWIRDVGLDGFRCDVAGAVPIEFWETARDAMDKVNREVIMLSEADVPEHQLKAFDISYNFPYYAALTAVLLNGEPAERIRQQWEKARAAFPRGSRFLHLNDNHDRNRADVVFGEKAAMTTSVLNFTLDGIPFLYNGQEIGDTTPPHQQARVAIRWEMYKPTAQPRSGLLGRQTNKLRFYKRLIEMRKQEPALTSGELVWIKNSHPDAVVSFVRRAGNDEILVLINTTNRPATVEVDLPAAGYAEARDLVKNQPARSLAAGARLSWPLAALDYVVAKRASPRIR